MSCIQPILFCGAVQARIVRLPLMQRVTYLWAGGVSSMGVWLGCVGRTLHRGQGDLAGVLPAGNSQGQAVLLTVGVAICAILMHQRLTRHSPTATPPLLPCHLPLCCAVLCCDPPAAPPSRVHHHM